MLQFEPYRSDNAGNVFGLAIRGFEAFQESEESRTRVVALRTSVAEQLENIEALESRECEHFDENRRPENQLARVRVAKKEVH